MKEQGLAGVMMWTLDLDDFMDHCGTGRYPLLRAVNVALGVPVANDTETLGPMTKHSVHTPSQASSAGSTYRPSSRQGWKMAFKKPWF